jgi:CheY-like chemotaxis protein
MTRILVVDDEHLVRNLTVQVLERAGYDVVSVADAQHAIELLEQDTVDLVVTDVVMPGQSGVELLNELRDRRPDIPVLLMTGGSPEPERTSRALELGASGIVYKPFSHADLTTAVQAALDAGAAG